MLTKHLRFYNYDVGILVYGAKHRDKVTEPVSGYYKLKHGPKSNFSRTVNPNTRPETEKIN